MKKTYRGYSIEYTDVGLYVTPPGALRWTDPFVNYRTACKHIDAHLIERADRSAHFAKLSK